MKTFCSTFPPRPKRSFTICEKFINLLKSSFEVLSNHVPTKAQRADLTKDRWEVKKLPKLTEADYAKWDMWQAELAAFSGKPLLPLPNVWAS